MSETAPTPVRALLRFIALLLPVCVLVFLAASDFFGSWDGAAVAVKPDQEQDPTSYEVLIVAPDRTTTQRSWRADVVEQLDLPIDPLLLPPVAVPVESPHTKKRAFQLYYVVEKPDGTHLTPATTSPQSVFLSVLLFFVGVALRNMYVSGSPIDLEPREGELPKPLPPSGQVVPTKAPKGQFGPPPRGSRKGKRRR